MSIIISDVLSLVDIDRVRYRVDINRVTQMRCLKVATQSGYQSYLVTMFDEQEKRIIKVESRDLVSLWEHLPLACVCDTPVGWSQPTFTWNDKQFYSSVRRQVYRLENSDVVLSLFWQAEGFSLAAQNIRQLKFPEDLLPLIPTAQQ